MGTPLGPKYIPTWTLWVLSPLRQILGSGPKGLGWLKVQNPMPPHGPYLSELVLQEDSDHSLLALLARGVEAILAWYNVGFCRISLIRGISIYDGVSRLRCVGAIHACLQHHKDKVAHSNPTHPPTQPTLP